MRRRDRAHRSVSRADSSGVRCAGDAQRRAAFENPRHGPDLREPGRGSFAFTISIPDAVTIALAFDVALSARLADRCVAAATTATPGGGHLRRPFESVGLQLLQPRGQDLPTAC